jgi:hypothetical protein
MLHACGPENQFWSIRIVDLMLWEAILTYESQKVPASRSAPMHGTYFVEDGEVAWYLPREKERPLESLCLRRVQRVQVEYGGRSCEIRLSSDGAGNGRPMPLLVVDANTRLPVRRQGDVVPADHTECDIPAFVIDAERSRAWYEGYINAPDEHTVVSRESVLLARAVCAWLGCDSARKVDATLVVDASITRNFVAMFLFHPLASCHLVCHGRGRLYVYFVLCSRDTRLEIARLPLGTVRV